MLDSDSPEKRYLVAADTGGTFTDVAVYDTLSRSVSYGKTLTQYGDLVDGVLEGLSETGVSLPQTLLFKHGTTHVINTFLQRSGARTALVTTRGFRDVVEIGRGNRPVPFQVNYRRDPPLVPRQLRFELEERMDHQGRVVTPLDVAGIEPLCHSLRHAGVEAVAVSFVNAYANPEHEEQAAGMIEAQLPGVYVTRGTALSREWYEYERTSTAEANAYVGARMRGYLQGFERRLRGQGFEGKLYMMGSNGGVLSVDRTVEQPVALVESGPIGGCIGAAAYAKAMGRNNIIAFDMGGTTAKTCLVEKGMPKMTDQYFIGGYQHGHPMRLPVVDIIEVGAGGGSMAWIDEGGSLKVGPRSAGSTPGPACYGRGGTEPTVTDANLVTGRLNPHRFLGGEFDLDLKLATQAIEQRIAKPLGLSVMDAALGILRIADAKMSFAVRAITMQRGYDPRKFAMVVFGGGGPLHGMAIARELHVPRVIVPPQPGHFSALGMLMTDLRQDFVQTKILDYASLTPSVLENLFKGLEQQALKSLQAEGHALDSIVLHRTLDMRYLGQEYTVRVPVPSSLPNAAALQALRLHFDELYETRYGHAAPDQSGELVNLRLTALGHVVKPSFASLQDKRIPAAVTQRHRPVVFPGVGQVDCPVLQRAELRPGQVIAGPAVIEEYASTTILHPGDSAVFHVDGCLVITLPVGAHHEA